MKKIFIIFAFTLLGVMAFSSCSKEEDEEEKKEELLGGGLAPVVLKTCAKCDTHYSGHSGTLDPCPNCGYKN